MSSFNSTLSKSKCLICFSLFQSERCKKAEYFAEVFGVFCRLLEIDLVYPIQWNFEQDGIPFCVFCCSAVEKLKELNDQFEFLQQQINHILDTTKQNILKSGSDSNSTNGVDPALLNRVNCFRHQVVKVTVRSAQDDSNVVSNEPENPSSVEEFIKVELPPNVEDEIQLAFLQPMNDESQKIEDGVINNDPLAPKGIEDIHFDIASVSQPNYPILNDFDKDPDTIFLDPNDCDSRVQSSSSATITITDQLGGLPDLHHSVTKHKCHFCEKSFRRKSTLQEHLKNHTSDSNQYHHPQDNILETESSVVSEVVHCTTFNCNSCSQSFSNLVDLSQHLKTHIQADDDKRHKCEHCDKTFANMSLLKEHRGVHTGARTYKCNLCDRSFNRSVQLERHRSTHTGEKPHKCEYCKKGFTQVYDLNRHRRIHTGEKKYKCDFCNRCFARVDYLISHKRLHTGEKPYKCDFCDKSFIRSSQMKLHICSRVENRVVV